MGRNKRFRMSGIEKKQKITRPDRIYNRRDKSWMDVIEEETMEDENEYSQANSDSRNNH